MVDLILIQLFLLDDEYQEELELVHDELLCN